MSKKTTAKKNSKGKKSRSPKMAKTADKFICYQKAVQTPEHEVEFFGQAFREAYNREPVTLREDFCGTFAICCEWVKTDENRTAVGVDLCEETLQWGRDNNLAKLDEAQQARVVVQQSDVRSKGEQAADVLSAQNFSFWIFKTRDEVIDYFKHAHANLNSEGIMVMDMMGGGACYEEGNVDKRTIKKGKKGFKYLWEQVSFNPVNADAHFRINFEFADGSTMKGAFEYEWRFWTIPEVREMLADAGFSESHVYWEREDDGKDTGEWERSESAPSHPSWICYIVALA